MKKEPLKLAEATINKDHFVGYIIRLASAAESRLDILLGYYFSPDEEFEEFYLNIASRLTFSAKIQILSKLKLHKRIKSQENLVGLLSALSFLRNKVAHDYFITGAQLAKVADNHVAMKFVLADAKQRGRLKTQIESCFHHIWNGVEKKRQARRQDSPNKGFNRTPESSAAAKPGKPSGGAG